MDKHTMPGIFTSTAYLHSPVGLVRIRGNENAVTQIFFVEEKSEAENPNDILIDCKTQLENYFSGTLRNFTVKVQPNGTSFQQQVWSALQQIPFGKTVSYGDVSKTIGNEKSIRAVGTANGQNPIAVIIPCHRVIGADGSLTGYSGGLWRKQWLLEHEQRIANGVQKLFL
jgi:methylated-DNA-[protein]-cysteine S-methyltransferase